jgi:hypothetical protein
MLSFSRRTYRVEGPLPQRTKEQFIGKADPVEVVASLFHSAEFHVQHTPLEASFGLLFWGDYLQRPECPSSRAGHDVRVVPDSRKEGSSRRKPTKPFRWRSSRGPRREAFR